MEQKRVEEIKRISEAVKNGFYRTEDEHSVLVTALDDCLCEIENLQKLLSETQNDYTAAFEDFKVEVYQSHLEIERLQKERDAATAVVEQAIQWLTPHPGDGSRAVERARLHLMEWRGLED